MSARTVLAASLALASCDPPQSEVDACAAHPECLTASTCVQECIDEQEQHVAIEDCCACLVEFGCTDATAERCTSNLESGGSVGLNTACRNDRSRCGVPCDAAGLN